jgi:putative addiction module component (TIGR02574 family)
MSTAVENILAQAMQLSALDRAAIAKRLISSLDTETDWDVEIAWQQEVQRRVDEVERGEVVYLPLE